MTTPTTPAAAVSLDDLSGQLLECIDGSPWLTCHVAKSLVRTVADELHMAAARESALIAERDALRDALVRIIAVDDAHATIHAPDGDDVARMIEWAEAFDAARAALQASRQPQAQQGRGDLSIYKARWCFALAESDDWTYAVCKWDGADWLPIKTEDDLRIFDAALATKEPK